MTDTLNALPAPVQKIRWFNLIFFITLTLLGCVGAPLYFVHAGISTSEILLFVFFVFVTSFSITIGYHRLFAHVSFKAHPVVRFLVLFFGAAAFQQSALKWASQHRVHHLYVDTDQDPYSIKKGFFYAHMGWLLFWDHSYHYGNVKDLQKSRLIRHQHRYALLWTVAAGILTPALIGAATGHLAGALLLSVCARVTLVYHLTWCINSVAHTFGKATYDIYSSAKDHWVAALLTNGEGYHNYHHHFPGDYRNGVRWYQWDPTKWIIAMLAKVGLAWDLKKVSPFRIWAAKLAAENQRIADRLEQSQNPQLGVFRSLLKTQHERLKQTLSDWEHSAREYQGMVRLQIARHSEARRQAAIKSLEARRRFQETLALWRASYLKLPI